MSLGQLVSIASIVGVLIVVAGVLGAAFRTSRNVQAIVNYREAAQSWEARATAQAQQIAAQDAQIGELRSQVADLRDFSREKDTQIAGMQEQIAGLRELIAGRATFESLEGLGNRIIELLTELRTEVMRAAGGTQ